VFQVPGMSHGNLSLDQPCGRSMIASFLRDPAAMPPQGCLLRIKKQAFYVPETR